MDAPVGDTKQPMHFAGVASVRGGKVVIDPRITKAVAKRFGIKKSRELRESPEDMLRRHLIGHRVSVSSSEGSRTSIVSHPNRGGAVVARAHLRAHGFNVGDIHTDGKNFAFHAGRDVPVHKIGEAAGAAVGGGLRMSKQGSLFHSVVNKYLSRKARARGQRFLAVGVNLATARSLRQGKVAEALHGGKGEGKKVTDFDPEQLAMGVEVEMEHTDDSDEALQITMDHLTEDPKYYTKLKGAGLADELEGKKEVSGDTPCPGGKIRSRGRGLGVGQGHGPVGRRGGPSKMESEQTPFVPVTLPAGKSPARHYVSFAFGKTLSPSEEAGVRKVLLTHTDGASLSTDAGGHHATHIVRLSDASNVGAALEKMGLDFSVKHHTFEGVDGVSEAEDVELHKRHLAHVLALAKHAPAEDRSRLKDTADLIRDRIKRAKKGQAPPVKEEEEKWSGEVKPKWHPKEGTFEKSAASIAKTLMAGGQKKALKRLAFYVNRAGKNLSPERRAVMARAKRIIQRTVQETGGTLDDEDGGALSEDYDTGAAQGAPATMRISFNHTLDVAERSVQDAWIHALNLATPHDGVAVGLTRDPNVSEMWYGDISFPSVTLAQRAQKAIQDATPPRKCLAGITVSEKPAAPKESMAESVLQEEEPVLIHESWTNSSFYRHRSPVREERDGILALVQEILGESGFRPDVHSAMGKNGLPYDYVREDGRTAHLLAGDAKPDQGEAYYTLVLEVKHHDDSVHEALMERIGRSRRWSVQSRINARRRRQQPKSLRRMMTNRYAKMWARRNRSRMKRYRKFYIDPPVVVRGFGVLQGAGGK